MKKYIPSCSLLTIAIHLLYCLVAALVGFDGAFFALLMLVVVILPLIAEIIGRIIAVKKHKPYADIVAIYIAAAVSAIPIAVMIISDLNSSGFMSGIAAVILLIGAVPLIAVLLIITTLVMIIRSRRKKSS